MKKSLFSLSVITALFCGCFTMAASAHSVDQSFDWNGFYLGVNAGYWNSQNYKFTSNGSASFINPTFASGASNIAYALAQMGTNRFTHHTNGFIGGAEVGYNYETPTHVLLGLEFNLDGLTNSNNNFSFNKTVNLVDFDENYVGSLNVNRKINYLGTVRGRLGYAFCPGILVYATGGFAFGNVTLDTSWIAQESLGPTVFPTISTQHNSTKTVGGWTAGGGVEWLFNSVWSTLIEYSYYSLNNFSVSNSLSQTNTSISPPALWGSAVTNTTAELAVWTIRVGINYHFASLACNDTFIVEI